MESHFAIRSGMFAILFAASLATPALSAGDGGSSGGSGNNSSTGQNTCSTGKVWNKKSQKCEQKDSVNDQDSLYEAGRDLAYAGRYEEAISVLMRAPELDDKRVLNFLGYSHRKLGRLDTGIAYYERSIRLDPDYALVREYYGEAMLQKDDPEAARLQLAEIQRICGNTECEPFVDLAEEIEAYAKKSG